MQVPKSGHEAVLLNEVIEHLAPGPGKVVVDCTVGRAGHASAIADRLGATGTLVGLDVDERNLEFAKEKLKDGPCTVRLFHANFSELDEVLDEVGVKAVDGILADLGVSTNQLFDEQYGLSFSKSMPLDMRLDSRLKRTAADLVNHMKEKELADLLFNLAQEHYSRQVARKIAEARRVLPVRTTDQLGAGGVSGNSPTVGGPSADDA